MTATIRAADQPVTDWEKILLDMGAFPVAKITKPYPTNGHDGQVWYKGRLDVDGWLPPGSAEHLLTDEQKAALPRKPWTPEQYRQVLQPAEYKKHHDPHHLIAMRFALHKMSVADARKEDILPMYEAQIGLNFPAIQLLNGKLTTEETMRLIRTYKDDDLFMILPAATKSDHAYLHFLAQQAIDERRALISRLRAFQQLHAADPDTYRNPLRDFLLQNTAKEKDWCVRAQMYQEMIPLKDDKCNQLVCEALLSDDVTECREWILQKSQQTKIIAPFLDAITKLARGEGKKCHEETLSRSDIVGWPNAVREYLEWAREQKDLDQPTRTKIEAAMNHFEIQERKLFESPATDP
jgi:hypothetical protein